MEITQLIFFEGMTIKIDELFVMAWEMHSQVLENLFTIFWNITFFEVGDCWHCAVCSQGSALDRHEETASFQLTTVRVV